MLSLKKLNSQKFSLNSNPFKNSNSFKRSFSLKPPVSKIETLRDLMVKKLENCLIIDQLNANKSQKVHQTDKKSNNFIVKTKFKLKNLTKIKPTPQTLLENPQKDLKIKLEPQKKKKKKHLTLKKKPEDDKKPIEKLEEKPEIHHKDLIIKQKGLAD